MKIEEYVYATLVFTAVFVLHLVIGNWQTISVNLDAPAPDREDVHVFLKVKLDQQSQLSPLLYSREA